MEYKEEVSGEHQGIEVFAPIGQPFEAPAKEFVEGPYYKAAEEVITDLTDEMGEQPDDKDLAVDRRDFMRLFSASAVLASTACVKRPVEKAIPYVNQPVDQVLGMPTFYATTCGECTAACGVIVKTREGRPIKIEGNPEHPISQGATCALGQSSLQGLYHPERRKNPSIRKNAKLYDVSWAEVYESLGNKLKNAKNVGILTGGSTGHRHEFFKDFLKQVGSKDTNLYTYESNHLLSSSLAAYKLAFGVDGLPRPDLRKAKMIVGIGSDFLEIGVSPVFHAKSFAQTFSFQNGQMGKFVQFETIMSQTGARANSRHVIPPKTEIIAGLLLVNALMQQDSSRGSGADRKVIQSVLDAHRGLLDSGYDRTGVSKNEFSQLARELLTQQSVVFCGGSSNFDENSTMLQLVGIMANILVGAYGVTLFLDEGWMIPPVSEGDLARFLAEAKELDLLIIIDTNPVFTLPPSFNIKDALAKITTVVSIQSSPNETDELAHYVLPGHHYLEAWGDEQPVAGFWSMRQPTIRPTTDSQQPEDVLIWLASYIKKPLAFKDYREYLKSKWRALQDMINAQNLGYETFYQAILRRGIIGKLSKRTVPGLKNIAERFIVTSQQDQGLVLVAPLDGRLRDGRGANRPVLQEVGDSMTTITWDSFVALNPNTAKKMGFRRNDMLEIESSAGTFQAALYPLPGLHPDAVMVPRGNGHDKGISKVTDDYGVNPLVAFAKVSDTITHDPISCGQVVKIRKVGTKYTLAAMQKHNDIANRKDIVKKISLETAAKNLTTAKNLDEVPDLYPKLEGADYRWGMSVDLTSCTGCSACMVACSVENNIPQVGRKQILMGREMHWIRLDRYFYGDPDKPTVTYQPVMCQQCNHAPCEAVCPVYATSHDAEGINGQTYNRCVGTRYCANACPYKVRRFNWFTHKWNQVGTLERDRNIRALNPEVTVRTRGIMEKCTFCIQRLRDAKHNVKAQGRTIVDGDVKTACQQVCPSNAIEFGNLLDPSSKISRLRKDHRAFLMLGGDPEHGHYGLKTLPNVNYLAQVTHGEPDIGVNDHHNKPEHHG